MAARGWELEKCRDVGKRSQTFSYEVSKFWRSNVPQSLHLAILYYILGSC